MAEMSIPEAIAIAARPTYHTDAELGNAAAVLEADAGRTGNMMENAKRDAYAKRCRDALKLRATFGPQASHGEEKSWIR